MSVVRRGVLALANLCFPGVAFALMSRPRALGAWLAALCVAILACTRSVWCMPLVLAVVIAGAVVAFRDAGRHEGRLNWALGAGGAAGAIVLAIVARLTVIEAFAIPASGMSPALQVGDHMFIDKLTPQFRSMEPGAIIVFPQPCTGQTYVKRVVARGGQTVEVRCGALYVDGAAVPTKRGATTCSIPDQDGQGHTTTVACSEYLETLGDHTYRILHDKDYPEHLREPGFADFPSERGQPPSCATALQASRVPPDEVIGTIAPSASPSADECAPHVHYVVPASHLFVLGDNRDNSSDSRFWGVVPEGDVIGRVVGIWSPRSRFGDVE